jgi:hypothetical protein
MQKQKEERDVGKHDDEPGQPLASTADSDLVVGPQNQSSQVGEELEQLQLRYVLLQTIVSYRCALPESGWVRVDSNVR